MLWQPVPVWPPGFQSLFFWKWCLKSLDEIGFQELVTEFQSLFFWKWCLKFALVPPPIPLIPFQSLFFWKWCLKFLLSKVVSLRCNVSILIFLEVVFKVITDRASPWLSASFNPYFSGSGV